MAYSDIKFKRYRAKIRSSQYKVFLWGGLTMFVFTLGLAALDAWGWYRRIETENAQTKVHFMDIFMVFSQGFMLIIFAANIIISLMNYRTGQLKHQLYLLEDRVQALEKSAAPSISLSA